MAEEPQSKEEPAVIATQQELLDKYESALFSIVSLACTNDGKELTQDSVRAALEAAGLPEYYTETEELNKELEAEDDAEEGDPTDTDALTDEDEVEVSPE